MNLSEEQIKYLVKQALIKEGFFDFKDSPVMRSLGYKTKEELAAEEEEAKRKKDIADKKALGMSQSDQERVDLDLDVYQLYADRLQPFVDILDMGKSAQEMYGNAYRVPEDVYGQYAPKFNGEKQKMDIDGDGDLDAGDIVALVKNFSKGKVFNLNSIYSLLKEKIYSRKMTYIKKSLRTDLSDDQCTLLIAKYFSQFYSGNFFFKKQTKDRNGMEATNLYNCIYLNILTLPSVKVEGELGTYDSEYGGSILLFSKTVVKLQKDIKKQPYIVSYNDKGYLPDGPLNIRIDTDDLFGNENENENLKSNLRALFRSDSGFEFGDVDVERLLEEKELQSDNFIRSSFGKRSNIMLTKAKEQIELEVKEAEEETKRLALEKAKEEIELQREKSKAGQEKFEKYGVVKGDEIKALHDVIENIEGSPRWLPRLLANANLLVKHTPLGLDIDIAGFGNLGKKLRRGILEYRADEKIYPLSKIDDKLMEIVAPIEEKLKEQERLKKEEEERLAKANTKKERQRKASLEHVTYGVQPGEELVQLQNLAAEHDDQKFLKAHDKDLFDEIESLIKKAINILSDRDIDAISKSSKIMLNKPVMKHLRKAIKMIRLGYISDDPLTDLPKASDKLWNTIIAMRDIE